MTPKQALIYEAIRFADWAAGEGITPVDGENASPPDDFLLRYSEATGDDEWDSLAYRIANGLNTQEAGTDA